MVYMSYSVVFKKLISPRSDRNLVILSVSDLIRVGHTILAYIENCCSTLSEFHGDVPELMPNLALLGWAVGVFLGGGGREGWRRGCGCAASGWGEGGFPCVLCVVFDVLLYVY